MRYRLTFCLTLTVTALLGHFAASPANAMRDPVGYADGMSMYQYARSNPIRHVDSDGLWGRDIHHITTRMWAIHLGYPHDAAETIGQADEDVDGGITGGGLGWAPYGDQSYHFDRNRGRGRDTRLIHYDEHLQRARRACTDWRSSGVRIMSIFSRDEPETAAHELGTALHPYQDWVAHGDYGYFIDGNIYAVHNAYSPQTNLGGDVSHYPDDPNLDAVNGPNGRPSGRALLVRVINRLYILPQSREYAIYQRGSQRYRLTSRMTIETLDQFREYVRQFGGCRCRAHFGI